MSLSEKHSTKTEVIDNFKMGDSTIHFVRFLRKSDTNKYTNKACSKFYKFVLDNGATPKEKNRKIQVIAWNENIKLIDDCNKVNMIIHVGPVQAVKIKEKDMHFNMGNVNFELLVQADCKVTISPKLYEEKIDESKATETTIPLAYSLEEKSVTGFIKTRFHDFRNRDHSYISASIADISTETMLEIRGYFNHCRELESVKKFTKVKVTGIIEKQKSGPKYLRVNSSQNIMINNEKADPLKVLKSFNIPQ